MLFRKLRVRIHAGPAKGFWWSVPTRSRFLRGSYELRLASFVSESLAPGDVFWDIGAHFGYYTLIAARALRSGKVFSSEPSTENLWLLRKHIEWNSLNNVTVLPFAIGATDGRSTFGGQGTGSGHLGGEGTDVLVRSIDSLIASGECESPSFIKLDVEGAEAKILRGSRQLLARRCTTLVIATHGQTIHDECLQILRDVPCSTYHKKEESLIIALSESENRGDGWVSRARDLLDGKRLGYGNS
jgi:FkbM family methyltransferase